MKYLVFSHESVTIEGRRVRAARFEERSSLPVSAACVVANGVREMLARLFDAQPAVKLFEPVIPSPQGWAAIAHESICFRLRGPNADAAIVLKRRDAVILAAAAFGETDGGDRALSQIEQTVLDRTLASIATALAPVCGFRGQTPVAEPLHDLRGFTTYFDLQIACPSALRLGIALSREPDAVPTPGLAADQLLEVKVELTAVTSGCMVAAEQLARLEVGQIVPITVGKVLRGTLELAGTPVGRGECGVQAGHYAVAVNES